MTYETKTTLEPAWASWLTDEENLQYRLNPPLIPENYKPWDGWDEPDAPITTLERVTNPDSYGSLELLQEMVWDVDAGTDDQVRDLFVYTAHRSLGMSRQQVAEAWGLTRKSVQSIVLRIERNMKDKEWGDTFTCKVVSLLYSMYVFSQLDPSAVEK